jgi:putative peptide zinc metalloprotease protein
MTSSADVAERRVLRSPDVVLGPGLWCGPTLTYAIKDQATGRRYQIGPREFFILSRLDGRRTLREIGEEYARAFNRRLGDAAWTQLLGLLAGRNLLAGTDRPPLDPRARGPRRGLTRLGPMTGRYVLGEPSAYIARIYRRLFWLYRPVVMTPLLFALVAMDAYLALRVPVLVAGLPTLYHQPSLWMLGTLLLWTATAVHELGHGLTCRHYGGNASAVGLRWFGPVVAAFCAVDDVHLFPARRARVATAAAGAIGGQLFLLPFFALWLWLPIDRATHDALGAVLLFGVAQSLACYLPVAPLDGYHMLAHGLNVTNLAGEARRYVRMRLGAALRGMPVPVRYPRWAGPVYLGYGLAWLVCFAALVVVLAWWAYRWPPARLIVLVGCCPLLYAFARYQMARSRSRKGRQQ